MKSVPAATGVALCLFASVLLSPLHAQTETIQIESLSPTNIVMLFTAPAATAIARFDLERNEAIINANGWAVEPAARFGTTATPTVYRVDAPLNLGAASFFRVLLDGIVITAGLGADSVEVGEGEDIPVFFSDPYTGTMSYVITLADGTTIASGAQILTDETSALISGLIEDGVVQGGRYLTVALSLTNGEGFTNTVSVLDNDEIWDGLLMTEDGGQLTFCAEYLRPPGGNHVMQLVNPNAENFFPAGTGVPVFNPFFDDNQISVVLRSNTLSPSDSPLGVYSYYELTLNGLARGNAATRTLYEGGTLGDATIRHVVGHGSGAFSPDPLEPNDSFPSATVLTPYDGLDIDPSPANLHSPTDNDYYAIQSVPGGSLTVRTEFLHSTGDLDLEVYGNPTNVLASSAGTTNAEQVQVTLAPNQVIRIRVYGYNGAQGDYRLMIGDGSFESIEDSSHLSSTRPGTFMLIKRPLPAADRKALLFTPSP